MMKRFTLHLLFLSFLFTNNSFSQARIENRLKFADAESWILFEDYEEALDLYLQLIKSYPTNSNLKYRIGQCYLYIPGKKENSIGYLEDALKNINTKYKEGKFKETGAPYDALYYLANAYRINNQIDKAIETYELFKKNMDTDIYNEEVVNQQIQSCRNALELMKIPFYVKETNVGNSINESYSEFNPVVSSDENIAVFTRALAFYNAIMYSTKTNGGWSGPMDLNEPLRVDVGRDLFPTSLSGDGKTIYIYGPEDYDGVIFSTTNENGIWGPLVKLNDNINTKYWESHATISHDNRKLYFTSNRKSTTIGKLDIYVSERDSTGDWGSAVNLGPVINTPENEETPFLSNDDKTLYFSSRGHFNMGGYDIFYSTLMENGQWSAPLNVGYPLNSTDDDVFFKPVKEGYVGYFARYSSDGFGEQDIYRIEIFSEEHPRKFVIRGIVKVADLINNAEYRVRISAMNITNPDQTIVVYSNPETGEYEFHLPQGKYELTYEAPGSEKYQRNLDLALNHPADSFVLPGTILPRTDFIADLIVNADRNITVIKGDTLIIPVKAEPGSVLTVEHWLGDSLLYTEKFIIADSVFNYRMVPQTGDNRISFTITDIFSNTTTTDVFIIREKGVTELPVVRPEYNRVIAGKQAAALAEIQKSRAEGDLKRIIFVLNEKILAYSENNKSGGIIRLALSGSAATSKEAGAMLQQFYHASLKNGLNDYQLAELFASISSMPDKGAEQYLKNLAEKSIEPFRTWLEGLDLKKEKIRTPADLILFILKNIKEGNIPGEAFFSALAELISDEDIPAETIKAQIPPPDEYKYWYLWLIVGGGLIIFIIILLRRRNKKKDKK